MNLVKAMATVAGLTGLSRVAGFVRDIMTASFLGAGPVADAFFVALKLPNFFRRVTAEGAFSVSFVPLYSRTIEKEGREAADAFAGNAFFVMLGLLSLFSLAAMAAMPLVIYVIAPGFAGDDLRYDLAVELSRITFPYLLLMSLTALLGGVLNTLGRFAPFAFAPTLFNLSLIAALLLSGGAETVGHALAWGIVAAGFLQLFWLMACARRAGFRLKPARPQLDPKVRQVFRLMGPGVLGAGVMHINLFADMILASFLQTGSISHLYYADRLNQLPLGVVGIAVGTALLPMLSKAVAAEREEDARYLFNRALEYCFLLALPAALALMVIPVPLIRTLFEHGAFGSESTAITANVLRAAALGLPAYIAVKVFATAYWARQDTVTPVKIAVVSTLCNIGLSLVLIWPLGVAGIALATGLAGWVQFYLYVSQLKGDPAAVYDERFRQGIVKITGCSALMGLCVFLLAWALGDVFAAGGAGALYRVPGLIALVLGGMIVYGWGVLASGAVDIKDVLRYLSRG